MKTADWVVTTGGRDHFGQCERCRTTLLVKLPMRLPELSKIMLEFVRKHQGCKAQKVER